MNSGRCERGTDVVHAGMRRRHRHLAGRHVRSVWNNGEGAGARDSVRGIGTHGDDLSNAWVGLCPCRFFIGHRNRGRCALAVGNRVRCESHRGQGRAAANADAGLTGTRDREWLGIVVCAVGGYVPGFGLWICGNRGRCCRRKCDRHGVARGQFVVSCVRSELDLSGRDRAVPSVSRRGHGRDRDARVIRRNRDIRRDNCIVEVALRWAGGAIAVRNRDRVRGCGVVHHIRGWRDHGLKERRGIDSLAKVGRRARNRVTVAAVNGVNSIVSTDRQCGGGASSSIRTHDLRAAGSDCGGALSEVNGAGGRTRTGRRYANRGCEGYQLAGRGRV